MNHVTHSRSTPPSISSRYKFSSSNPSVGSLDYINNLNNLYFITGITSLAIHDPNKIKNLWTTGQGRSTSIVYSMREARILPASIPVLRMMREIEEYADPSA